MRILLILLLFSSIPVEARMYQWLDAETGTTQLSGKPPTWYRSDQSGPRIFVFDGGKIVDDTGIKVSEEHRELLRQRAYDIAAEESILARAKAIEALKEKQLAARRDEISDTEEEFVEDEPLLAESDSRTESRAPVEVEEEKVVSEMSLDDMKKLIQDWEAQQEAEAKKLIK